MFAYQVFDRAKVEKFECMGLVALVWHKKMFSVSVSWNRGENKHSNESLSLDFCRLSDG